MYHFANTLDADAIEAVALKLYIEMLKQGYTAVGEFHYLHHNLNGAPYANPAELSQRIIQAADDAGIGLTLLPVLYTFGGFGGHPPTTGQRRFIQNTDPYIELIEAINKIQHQHSGFNWGIAPHSLRAVTPSQLEELLTWVARYKPEAPIHIHIAEQQREVQDCYAWSGQRPVRWALDHLPIDKRWCLIHATHMVDDEIDTLAEREAVVGLCPTTEADLGDGICPAAEYLEAGGRIAIGSDSNTRISPADELRMLEYGQRLKWKCRNVLALPNEPSIGQGLFKKCAAGGAQALGRRAGKIATGYTADLVVLDQKHPLFQGKVDHQILDTWIFAGSGDMVRDVYVRGHKVVEDHVHRLEKAVD